MENSSQMARGMMPAAALRPPSPTEKTALSGAVTSPIMVCVLPEPVTPKAKIVALYLCTRVNGSKLG